MPNTALKCKIKTFDNQLTSIEYLNCTIHDVMWDPLNRGFEKQCPVARVIELEGAIRDIKIATKIVVH